MESFRKAYGALKDSTKVGLAKVNSEFKDLDIAIVKATNHAECPPKERHVRKIFAAVSISCPRADVGYCIHALTKRLHKTSSWIVAIKSLIVFHRILRESDASFREELMQISRRGHIFLISNFKDDSSPLAWDCSAWVRTYALYLEERLDCFRNLKYDIESDRALKKSVSGQNKELSKIQLLNGKELLEHLPALQQLLYRLVCCQPEGAARHTFLVQYALAMVVKESFKVYCAINDGIINLVDTYFEMPKHEAVRALNIYKKAGRQADHLADFYDFCRTLDLARTFQFPVLRQPPPSFLATMEEYIKEAPQAALSPPQQLEYPETKEEEEEEETVEEEEETVEEEEEEVEQIKEEEKIVEEETKQENDLSLFAAQEPADLLGLNEVNPQALQLDESNALALAIVQPGDDPLSSNNALSQIGNTSGWELALVTAQSNTTKPRVAQTNMGGGFDKLLLDSLYEDDAGRRQLHLHSRGYSSDGYGYGYDQYGMVPQNHAYDQRDPFAMSNAVAPPRDVQMAMMSQQQQMAMQQQQQYQMMMQHQHQHQHQHQNMMMMVPHNPYTSQYPQQQMAAPTNPFGDPFSFPQTSMSPHGNHGLL
ncbi:hypothetical protein ACS0TY_016513 [Phlomoides rotata]